MTSVLVPDSGDYVIKGNVSVTQTLGTTGKLSVLDTSDVDLESPLLSDAALSVSGGIFVNSNAYIGGNLVVAGDVITLGLTESSITFGSGISSDVSPSDDLSVNLGSSQTQWNKVYAGNIVVAQTPAEIIDTVDTTIATSEVTLNTVTQVTLPSAEVGMVKVIYVKELIQSPVQISSNEFIGTHSGITLTAQGDSVTLMYRDTGWVIVSMFGTTSVVN